MYFVILFCCILTVVYTISSPFLAAIINLFTLCILILSQIRIINNRKGKQYVALRERVNNNNITRKHNMHHSTNTRPDSLLTVILPAWWVVACCCCICTLHCSEPSMLLYRRALSYWTVHINRLLLFTAISPGQLPSIPSKVIDLMIFNLSSNTITSLEAIQTNIDLSSLTVSHTPRWYYTVFHCAVVHTINVTAYVVQV